MQLHQISPIQKQKTKKRVGRGGAHGTFSGRGVKGQKSRAGAKIRPAWRDLIKQIPKKRGYRFKPALSSQLIINLSILNKVFIKETKETVLEKPSGISYAIPISHLRKLAKRNGIAL